MFLVSHWLSKCKKDFKLMDSYFVNDAKQQNETKQQIIIQCEWIINANAPQNIILSYKLL